MNEFNFRVANAAPRASGFEIGQNVGDTKTTYIYSYKTKYINGKSTGQKTNVDWDIESSIPWVSVKYVFEGNDCKVTFTTLQENTDSSARTHTLVIKQRESGKTISFTISQEPTFTYTLKVLNLLSNERSFIGGNLGDTVTIMVLSYMTRRSDGEQISKQPSVGATPSFASKVTFKDVSDMTGAPHLYNMIVEATAANTGSSERSGILLVTCGDQRKEVNMWQLVEEQYITLTIHWPLNTNLAAFFKKGQTPQSGSTGTAYRNFSVLDDTSVHKYRKSKGIIVNLQNGSTEIAFPGNSISAYRFTNQAWQSLPTFILPPSNRSIYL